VQGTDAGICRCGTGRRVRTVDSMHKDTEESRRRPTERGVSARAGRDSRTLIGAGSLVIGPLLMATGDLLHPKEELDAAAQAVLVVDSAWRWYAAHLLLLIGILVLIPGIQALARLAAERRPALGHAAQVLMPIGMSAFAAIFASEMLVGRYAADGAGPAATAGVLRALQSGQVLGILAVPGIAFFAGVAAFVIPMSAAGPLRAPAIAMALGAALVLAEIVSAQVLLSQIGNVVIASATVAFARHLLRRDRE